MKRMVCFLALAAFLSAGCEPAKTNSGKAPANAGHSHDHGSGHAHPETLADGFKELSESYSVIKKAFEDSKPDDAHGPLHDIAHLLEDVKGLIGKSELDDDTKAKISANVEKLYDGFTKIDEFFHGGPAVDFAEVDKTLAPAMQELQGLIK